MVVVFVVVRFVVVGRVAVTERVLGMEGRFARREAETVRREGEGATGMRREGEEEGAYVEMEAAEVATQVAVKERLREEAEQQAQAQVGVRL